jgi:hypothetical protein
VAFAVVANVILVPRFSQGSAPPVASAWIIIGGELILALLFAANLRHHLGDVAWGKIAGRPAAAGAAMGATAWLLWGTSQPLALLSSLVIYMASLVLLRALTAEERGRLAALLPAPLRRAVERLAA